MTGHRGGTDEDGCGHLERESRLTITDGERGHDAAPHEPPAVRPEQAAQLGAVDAGRQRLVGGEDEPLRAGQLGDAAMSRGISRREFVGSPINVADRIRTPLLLLHGSDDEAVVVEQSQIVADRVRAAGGTVERHVYDGEGHGWGRPATVVDEIERITDFLRRHVLRWRV